MKKIFLIPLMSLLTCVMAWGVNVGTFAELQTALAGSDALITATAKIEIASDVALDLNGKTVNFTDGWLAINSGNVSIENGTISVASYLWNAIELYGGSLTLNCTVIGGQYNGIYMSGGDLTVNGGTISGPNNGIYTDGGTIIVNDGTIRGTNNQGIYITAGDITCNGGDLYAPTYGIYPSGFPTITINDVTSHTTLGGGDYWNTSNIKKYTEILNNTKYHYVATVTALNEALSSQDDAVIKFVGGKLSVKNESTIIDLQGKTVYGSFEINSALLGTAQDAYDLTTVVIKNGTIEAERTGLYIGKTKATLEDCIVNVSGESGDVIGVSYTCPTNEYKLDIENCTFNVTGPNAYGLNCNTIPSSNDQNITIDIYNSDFIVQGTSKAEGIVVGSGSTVNFHGGNINARSSNGAGAGVDLRAVKNTLTNTRHTIFNMEGGTIYGLGYGIVGNGGEKNTDINISGGTIQGEWAGIYHPQEGSLVIKGNPVIKGENAIQLCAGVGMTGSITGGRFEAYGTDIRATKTGDGIITDGAALSIVNRNYPGGMPTFAINGGTFLAQHQDAILAYTWDNSQAVGSKHSTWAAATSHLSVREGIFSSDPTTYVPAEGYTVTKLNPTPTVYNHDEVVYSDLWQVGEASHVQSYDFTAAEAEYVEISSTTPSEKLENKTYTLNEDQSSKKVEVAEDYTLIIKEDKQLNIGTGGLVLEDKAKLVVEPGAVVTVGTNGIINVNGTENLVLETSSEKQAALLIDPDVIQNTQPLATVTIHTAARQKSANPYNYIWEYFACPVQEITDANKPTNNFDAAVQGLYAGEASFMTGVYTWGGNDWTLVSSWKSLVPFKGYQLTNNSANGGVDYTFKGNLMGNGDGTYEFTTNGYGYFGNSYTAPIVISNFLGALDNSVYERTVWLYDAGADTYVSVNPLAARLGSAKYKDGTSIKEIRSLQAFILNKKADGAAATVNYRDAIWNNPRINSLAAPAPARHAAEEMQWSNIYVAANGKKEMVTLIEGADFSSEFDNGADAGKYINNNSMNLYAATNDGKQAIVATDNLENTILSFQAGDATEYTLSFENGNENYMLRDNVTGAMVAIADGAEYTFTQAANTTNPARFEVVAIAKVPTAIENVEEAAKATGIYTITGQYMGRDFTVLPAGVYVVNGVKVVK